MSLASMARGMAPSVEIGRVQSTPAACDVPGAELAARCVEVEILASGRIIEARVANIGQGVARGLFVPPSVGDEVLVLIPGGRTIGAIVIGGLGSAAAPNPVANDGNKIVALHPGGVELRAADGLPTYGILTGAILGELSTFMIALEAFMFASSTATTAPQVAAAAVAFMAAVQQVGPAPSPFSAQLLAASKAGETPEAGGPPYATGTHKTTL